MPSLRTYIGDNEQRKSWEAFFPDALIGSLNTPSLIFFHTPEPEIWYGDITAWLKSSLGPADFISINTQTESVIPRICLILSLEIMHRSSEPEGSPESFTPKFEAKYRDNLLPKTCSPTSIQGYWSPMGERPLSKGG